MSTLRVLVLGDSQVGKSALTVRFLTRRYIGEYRSFIDLLYRCTIDVENNLTNIEILDSSGKSGQSSNVDDEALVKWAEAYIIVYSVLQRSSFLKAKSLVDQVISIKQNSYVPLMLLGNKIDLDLGREVTVQEGRELARDLKCSHREVSAADDLDGSVSAFQSLIREAIMYKYTVTKRRKNSLGNVSKKLGAMFGKKEANNSTKFDGTGNVRNSWTEIVKM